MKPILPRQCHHIDFAQSHLLEAQALGIPFHHEENGRIVEDGRDGGHDQNFEIRDLKNLSDQERGGAKARRRENRADASGC